MDYGDCYWGLYRDSRKDPFPFPTKHQTEYYLNSCREFGSFDISQSASTEAWTRLGNNTTQRTTMLDYTIVF